MKQDRETGFTLIELSIVLVVIGLIVGGVLVGRDLIKAAQLRSVVGEVEKLRTAVNTYKLKYNALPGDDPNATQYWGADPAGCSNAWRSFPTIQQATCNGNGDGKIDAATESFRAFQHLANAGLIPGQYSGGCVDKVNFACTTYPDLASVGVNTLPSRFGNNVGYTLFSQYTLQPQNNGYYGIWFSPSVIYDLVIWFGSSPDVLAAPDGYFNSGAVLSGPDALRLDSKIDDGLPLTGKIVGNLIYDGCVGRFTTPPTAIYTTNTAIVCSVMFLF